MIFLSHSFFLFFFFNFKVKHSCTISLCRLKTQECVCVSLSRCMLPLHSVSQANLLLIIHISSIFQNQVSADPYDVQLGLWMPACAPPARLVAEAWKEEHGVVLDNGRISAVCLREEKNRLNKWTKLIVEHLTMFPMMQSAAFQQRINQKSRGEWRPLHDCMTDFITL